MCCARWSPLAYQMKSTRRRQQRKNERWKFPSLKNYYYYYCELWNYVCNLHLSLADVCVCCAWFNVASHDWAGHGTATTSGTANQMGAYMFVARLLNWNCRISIISLCVNATRTTPKRRGTGTGGTMVSISHSWEIRRYALQFSGDVRRCAGMPKSLWLHTSMTCRHHSMALRMSTFICCASNLYL